MSLTRPCVLALALLVGCGPRGEAPAGQQWLYLVAQDGIDCGLFDTLAQRLDAPRGPADGGARGYLQGEALHLAVYADKTIGFIAEQVGAHLGNWANFTKGSAKT